MELIVNMQWTFYIMPEKFQDYFSGWKIQTIPEISKPVELTYNG